MEPLDGDILDVSQLCFDGDFSSQVVTILQKVRMSRGDVEHLQTLLEDLHYIFQRYWPGCEVQPFGSIVTGLGMKTSDVDCFVRLPNEEDITNDIVFIAKNILRQYNIFGKLFAIANAKVPIVKFLHYPTNCYCDVNFKSQFGVRNSKLIAYFLNSDRKALELTVLIKYWAKVHKFTGTNLISNYALTLLVIFYLQQKQIYPSVYDLQISTSTYFVNCWDTAFDSSALITNNTESLYDIMGGFFKYYSQFDFNELIVSPYLGRPVKKALFKSLDSVPHEFSIYKCNVFNKVCQSLKINTPMCIQDPFEHDRNCSGAVHPKLINNVLLHISFAVQKYEEEENDFLKAILTGSPTTPHSHPESNQSERNNRAVMNHRRPITNNRIVKNNNKKGKFNIAMRYRELQKMTRNKHRNKD